MLSFFDYFYANLNMYIVLMISAFVIAYIFVLIMERYFNVTLKNPVGKVNIGTKYPVGRIPKMNNPVGRIPRMNNPVGRIPRVKKDFWRFL